MDPESPTFNPRDFTEAEVCRVLVPIAEKRLPAESKEDAGLVTLQAVREFNMEVATDRFWPFFCQRIRQRALDAKRERNPAGKKRHGAPSPLQFSASPSSEHDIGHRNAAGEATVPAAPINIDANMTLGEILRFIDTTPRLARWSLRAMILADWDVFTCARVFGLRSTRPTHEAIAKIRITRFSGRRDDARRLFVAG